MRISIKHFLFGGLLGLIPVILYGNSKLAGNYPQPQVIAAKTQFVPQTVFMDISSITASPSAKTASPYQPSPTPTATPTPKPKLTPKEKPVISEKPEPPVEVNELIEKYAEEYGANKDMMIHIARCESGFRENATNGPYAGIYQFVSSTWNSNRRAMGLDPNPNLRFNAEESIKTAAFKMGRDGYGAWPVCQNKAKYFLSLSSSDI